MAGGFMADAYSRVSGRPGVYLTSTGPAAANSMGAVIEAYSCGARVLQITSEIDSKRLGRGMQDLHEVRDQRRMFEATGVRVRRAATPEEIAPAISEAMRDLGVGRPVPQVVEIPIDAQYAEASVAWPEAPTPEPPAPNDADIASAAGLLAGAERPALWIGGGAVNAGAFDEVARVAERLGAPIFTTRGGRGILNEDHPLVVGNYFGEKPALTYLQTADAILAVGTKFSWHSTAQFDFRPSGRIARVDIDPAMLEQNFPAAVAIRADARLALSALAERLEKEKGKAPKDAAERIGALRERLRADFREHRPLNAALMDALESAAPPERIVVTDTTMPAYWGANQYLPVRARRGFVTARLSAIGPGLPMALGAQAAAPDAPVLCIVGDGGLMCHLGDLATAVQEKLPVVVVIFNNRGYGVIEWLQDKMVEGRRFATELHTPDFVKVAEAFEIAGETARTPEELKAAARRGFDARAPFVIDYVGEFDA
jgi:acetolactate synthase-1/2/3 large subunit